MNADDLQQKLRETQERVISLQQELEQANKGMLALTVELEQREKDLRMYRDRLENQAILHDVSEQRALERALSDSEAKNRALLIAVPDMMFHVSNDGTYLDFIPGQLSDPPISPDVFIGKKIDQIMPPEIAREQMNCIKQALKKGEVQVSEYQLGQEDNSHHYEARFVPVEENEVLAIARDITERKRAEGALRESEERYRALVNLGAEVGEAVVMLQDTEQGEGIQIFVNDEWPRITGYSRDELLGMSFFDLVSPNDRKASLIRHRSKMKGKGIPGLFQMRIVRKDGTEVFGELTSAYTTYMGTHANVAYIRDITERKKAESALKESEEKHRSLVNNVKVGVYRSTPGATGKFLEVNPAMEEITGYPREELLRMNVCELYATPSERGKVVEEVTSSSVQSKKELFFKKKDGTEITTWDAIVPVRNSAGEVLYFDGILEDITERKKAEDSIRAAAEEWRTTFDSISDMLSIHDKDFKIARVNKAFAKALNMQPNQLIGKTCYKMMHGTEEPPPGCPHRQTLKTGEPVGIETFEPTQGVYLEISASPVFDDNGGVVASVHIAKDITERKKMEEQLIITDRLASIGELASGIAHELNNPLTGVIGYSDLLLEKDLPDDIQDDLKVINDEAKRTAQVVKNLLTFARKHSPERHPTDISSVIEKVLELRAYEQRVNNIKVVTQFAPDLPTVIANAFELQQVLINIIINAEYFMSEAHGGGNFTISTEQVDNFVRASFVYDGPGIAPETLGHLFDPFFTTKEVGKGTGLGLSISYGIIAAHEGRIYAESEPGNGTSFIIELPVNNE
jgi:PAS domain S-box-containing protein